VMAVVEILSRRREYTKLNPFIVLLGKGVHEITSSYEDPYNIQGKLQTSHDDPYHSFAEVRITRPCTLRITCNSISFLGQGNEETIIKGGFAIEEQQNIMFKQMTVTNPSGAGMIINDAEVELSDIVIENCEKYALNIRAGDNSTLVARRCEFQECQGGLASYHNTISHFHDCTFHAHNVFGLYVVHLSIVHLYGESTAVHSNRNNGIHAQGSGKVIIHLPSHHNTSYNNGGQDRHTAQGGTITNVED